MHKKYYLKEKNFIYTYKFKIKSQILKQFLIEELMYLFCNFNIFYIFFKDK